MAKRLATGAFERRRLTAAAQLLFLATAPLAPVGDDDKAAPDLPLFGIDAEPQVDHRSPEWQALVRAAFRARKDVLDAVTGAIARRQGAGGGPTAIDPTPISRPRLVSDPLGTKHPPKDDRLLQVHSDLLRLAEAGVSAERQRIGKLVAGIEEHIGVGASLTLKTIQDSIDEALEEARRASVRTEEMDRSPALPTSMAASKILDDARRSIRAADNGVTADSLEQICSLDTRILAEIEEYLVSASRVIEGSIDAARALITEGTRGDAEAAVPARTAIARAIDAVREIQ